MSDTCGHKETGAPAGRDVCCELETYLMEWLDDPEARGEILSAAALLSGASERPSRGDGAAGGGALRERLGSARFRHLEECASCRELLLDVAAALDGMSAVSEWLPPVDAEAVLCGVRTRLGAAEAAGALPWRWNTAYLSSASWRRSALALASAAVCAGVVWLVSSDRLGNGGTAGVRAVAMRAEPSFARPGDGEAPSSPAAEYSVRRSTKAARRIAAPRRSRSHSFAGEHSAGAGGGGRTGAAGLKSALRKRRPPAPAPAPALETVSPASVAAAEAGAMTAAHADPAWMESMFPGTWRNTPPYGEDEVDCRMALRSFDQRLLLVQLRGLVSSLPGVEVESIVPDRRRNEEGAYLLSLLVERGAPVHSADGGALRFSLAEGAAPRPASPSSLLRTLTERIRSLSAVDGAACAYEERTLRGRHRVRIVLELLP